MKKRMIIMIVILVIIFVIGTGITLRILSNSNKSGKEDGIVGNDYCTTDHSKEIAGDALTEWKCELCGVTAINSDTNVPKLCSNCAIKTGRCNYCGKLK